MVKLRGWFAIFSFFAAILVLSDPIGIFAERVFVRLLAGSIGWAGVSLGMLEFGIRIAFDATEEGIDRALAFVMGIAGGLVMLIFPLWLLGLEGRLAGVLPFMLFGILFYVVGIRWGLGDLAGKRKQERK